MTRNIIGGRVSVSLVSSRWLIEAWRKRPEILALKCMQYCIMDIRPRILGYRPQRRTGNKARCFLKLVLYVWCLISCSSSCIPENSVYNWLGLVRAADPLWKQKNSCLASKPTTTIRPSYSLSNNVTEITYFITAKRFASILEYFIPKYPCAYEGSRRHIEGWTSFLPDCMQKNLKHQQGLGEEKETQTRH
jgi:hypothetical protein